MIAALLVLCLYLWLLSSFYKIYDPPARAAAVLLAAQPKSVYRRFLYDMDQIIPRNKFHLFFDTYFCHQIECVICICLCDVIPYHPRLSMFVFRKHIIFFAVLC